MRTIVIEEKAFHELMFRLEMFINLVKSLSERLEDKKAKKWYDNQDVCLRLNISLRTLQTMRSNGTLPYTQVNRKMYYRPADVAALIIQSTKTDKKRENNDQ